MTEAETAPSPDRAPAPVAGTAFGPGGRPTGGLRPYLAGVLALGAVLAVPIMLTDAAPGFFDRVTDRMENSFPDLWWDVVKPRAPAGDVTMHLVFFAGLALVVGLLSWSWGTFVVGQLAVAGLGFTLELLQPVFTSTRDVELHDVVSNLLGQTAGVLAALALVALLRWRRGSEALAADR